MDEESPFHEQNLHLHCSVMLSADVIASCLPLNPLKILLDTKHFMKEERFSPTLQMEKLRQLDAEFYLLIYSVRFIFHVEEFVYSQDLVALYFPSVTSPSVCLSCVFLVA